MGREVFYDDFRFLFYSDYVIRYVEEGRIFGGTIVSLIYIYLEGKRSWVGVWCYFDFGL